MGGKKGERRERKEGKRRARKEREGKKREILFFTNTHCWMEAADWDTNSRSFPSRAISSFCPVWTHWTPLAMVTRLTYFSPKKFLTSTVLPPSWMAILMGKWA